MPGRKTQKKTATFTLRLGTRSSNLALTQSRLITGLLEKAHPGLKVELVEIKTTGDEVRDKPLHSFGGAGVFVKELEIALIENRIDLAVHSLKDMPTVQPAELILGAIAGREDPRDVAVVKNGVKLKDLPPGSVIGTGSMRRRAQIKFKFPQLAFTEIRGNVETRLRKVAQGEYSGTILARAGLRRLGLLARATETLPLATVLPAPGQGALGIECRKGDLRVRRLLKPLHNPEVASCVIAERAALQALGGGCHLPLGAVGTVEAAGMLRLKAVLGHPDGSLFARAEDSMPLNRARQLGQRVAKMILNAGGQAILDRLDGEKK